MDVIFLHGPVAVGKRTIGTLLSTLVGMPLFHNHLVVDAVKALFEFGSKPFIALREQMWLSAFDIAAEASRSFIFTFNPEASVAPDLIGRLHDVVASHGGRILFVELSCTETSVLARIDSPARAQYGKLVDPELYQQVQAAGGFEFPSLPEPIIVVDTDAHAPIDSAHLIATAYRETLPPVE
jgi:hypothetical protein